MCIAVYLVTHTFDITMAIFDVGTHIVSSSAGIINGSTDIDFMTLFTNLKETLIKKELHGLILISLSATLIGFTLNFLSIVITFVLYGRIIEIYLYCSIAPIPFATISNKEWG